LTSPRKEAGWLEGCRLKFSPQIIKRTWKASHDTSNLSFFSDQPWQNKPLLLALPVLPVHPTAHAMAYASQHVPAGILAALDICIRATTSAIAAGIFWQKIRGRVTEKKLFCLQHQTAGGLQIFHQLSTGDYFMLEGLIILGYM